MLEHLDAASIIRFHDQQSAGEPAGGEARPRGEVAALASGAWRPIGLNHRCNRLLWDEEDKARRRDVPAAEIARCKRLIDGYNQQRNDAVEAIDEALLFALAGRGRAPDARLHSETAGCMIDRLSILSLKIFHMGIQARREDADEGHRDACRAKLARLREQRQDLAGCLDRLLREAAEGRSYFKVYRQFKMYNDPALNPWLHGAPAVAGKVGGMGR